MKCTLFDRRPSAPRMRLVFAKFRELGTARQVMCYLVAHSLKLPRRQITGPNAGVVL